MVPVANVEVLHCGSCGKRGGVTLWFLWQTWRCYIVVPVASVEVLHCGSCGERGESGIVLHVQRGFLRCYALPSLVQSTARVPQSSSTVE